MDFRELAEARKSVQHFDPEARLDDSVIEEIYGMAKLAPSSFNLQPWKILIVKDEARKEKLKECAFNQEKVTQASHVMVFLGDRDGYKAEQMDRALDGFVKNGYLGDEMRETMKGMAKSLYEGRETGFVSRNVGLLAMSVMYAAKSLGVDTHPMDGFDADATRAAFNIPERYDIVMMLALGKFDTEKTSFERKERKAFGEVVVKESF